jgi:phosphomannomutase
MSFLHETLEYHSRALNQSTSIKFVNTSMHGVSHVLLSRGFERFGFKPFIPMKEQQNPDPEFPTVKYPNPEEAGMSYALPREDPVIVDPTLGALVNCSLKF